MKRRFSMRLAVLAVFCALQAVFYPIPFVFLLPLILASLWFDFPTSLILSVIFGCISLVYSLFLGGAVSLAFRQLPWIAIAARVFVGPAVYGFSRAMRRLRGEKKGVLTKILTSVLPAAVGTLVNSLLVIGAFAIFGKNLQMGAVTMALLVPQMIVSAAIEIAVCAVTVPMLDTIGRKVLSRTSLGENSV